MQTLDEQITEYLTLGGMFNPELMDHSKVREILIRCREDLQDHHQQNLEIIRLRKEITRLKQKHK